MVILGLVLVLSSGAHAQSQAPSPSSADPTTTAAARSLFERGAEAADAGDHATAADLFARSQALRPSPVVAFNLAQSLAALGRLVEASELLVGVEHDATNDALREAASALRAEVAPRLAHVTVAISPPDTDAEVRLDGTVLVAALRGAPTPVDPGTHVATALREGVEVARAETTVIEGTSSELPIVVPAVTIVDEPIFEDPIVVPVEHGDDTVLIVVITAVAVAVVGGVAIGLGVGLSSQGPSPVSGNLSPPVLRFGP